MKWEFPCTQNRPCRCNIAKRALEAQGRSWEDSDCGDLEILACAQRKPPAPRPQSPARAVPCQRNQTWKECGEPRSKTYVGQTPTTYTRPPARSEARISISRPSGSHKDILLSQFLQVISSDLGTNPLVSIQVIACKRDESSRTKCRRPMRSSTQAGWPSSPSTDPKSSMLSNRGSTTSWRSLCAR